MGRSIEEILEAMNLPSDEEVELPLDIDIDTFTGSVDTLIEFLQAVKVKYSNHTNLRIDAFCWNEYENLYDWNLYGVPK